jgi:DNA modification methylase
LTVQIITGDAREALKALPAGSVQCVVTSPPFFNLRDYGTASWEGGDAACDHRRQLGGEGEKSAKQNTSAGMQSVSYRSTCGKCGARRIDKQIGLESSPEAYVAELVAVFREVRRVLHDSGVMLLNIGDSYAATTKGTSGVTQLNTQQARAATMADRRAQIPAGLKPKDLIGIPWLTAFALRADGWWLRSEIIWHKPAPMPESVIDRPTKAHEQVFLLTKRPRYFWDTAAIAEPASEYTHQRRSDGGTTSKQRANGDRSDGESATLGGAFVTRNRRSVWTIASQPFADSHFACVDEQTECLTTEGWKGHGELRVGMTAAQFNMDTQKLSWAPVEKVARYDVTDQDMVVGKCRDLDMWLTPNHRTVIQRRHHRTRKKKPPIIVRADALLASHCVPTAAEWDFHGDASLSLEWAEFLGWYIAEGHESKDSLAIEIYQSDSANPHKCRRIEELLRQIGAEWTKATCDRTWKAGVVRKDPGPTRLTAYRVLGYAAVRLRELAPGKRLPWATVMWSQDRIAALLQGLVEGDGHTRVDGRRSFIQKDKDQCDLVQALAMRLGFAATVSVRPDRIGTVYITSHTTRSFRGTNGIGARPEIRPYTGVVWCPKLPLGTWVARRNGRAFITGNTMPPALAELCILAGSSARGQCPHCGAPWVRQVEVESRPNNRPTGQKHDGTYYAANPGGGVWNDRRERIDRGWAPSCACPAHEPVPQTILDPFGGAGTTGLVADRLQRNGVMIELNPAYAAMARARINGDAPLFAGAAE